MPYDGAAADVAAKKGRAMELPSPVARLVPSLVLNAVVTFENPHAPKDDTGTGPLVSFARSGIAAHWKPSAYQSILELAEACDVPVRWSCRTGVCHSC